MFGLFFVGADGLTRGGAPGCRSRRSAGGSDRRRGCWSGATSGGRRRSSRSTCCANPVFALSVAASICAFAAFIIAFVALPFYFQSILGRDQVETGL